MLFIHLINKTVKAQKAKVSSFTPQKQVGGTKNARSLISTSQLYVVNCIS